MIQRYLYELLDDAIEAIKTDNAILDDIFSREYGLDASEVSAIKEHFDTAPPKVYNGYQKADTNYPAILVTLGREGESVNLLDNYATWVMGEDDPLYRADVKAEIWEHSYDIMVYSQHIDVTQYYYELVKTIILANHDTLVDLGLFAFSLSGSELAPDLNFKPQHYMFLRQLTLRCKREFQYVDRESLKYKGRRVAGIHIDSSGSTGDVEGVDTHVTPYSEDE